MTHHSALEVGMICQSLVKPPILLEDSCSHLINEVDADQNDTIDFPGFLNLMARKLKNTDSEEELKEAFKSSIRFKMALFQLPSFDM